MIRANSNLTAEGCKGKFPLKIGFDVFANTVYQFVPRRWSHVAGLTTMTRPETRLFGFNRSRKEYHMFLGWTSSWTRRSTIDPRRANREDERSVEPVVSRQNSFPFLIVTQSAILVLSCSMQLGEIPLSSQHEELLVLRK